MLLSVTNASLAFGHWPLLDHAEFKLDAGERVGLIGRNGSGKSSLLKVLAGEATLDSGERWLAKDCRVTRVAQEPVLEADDTIFHAVSRGVGPVGEALNRYHELSQRMAAEPELAEELGRLQATIENDNGWSLNHRVETVLTRLSLPADVTVASLSGGWRKRVALAQALAYEPDVLLLDEPTNHLDIAAIEWLEAWLRDFRGAVVCITHDRRFLDAISTRIVELDRGRLTSFPGQFSVYQERKTQMLADEAVVNAKFDKFLAQEEVWIRKGVEARRTRNEGRVRRLEQLRRDRSSRRERLGNVRFGLDAGEKSGQVVAELHNVSKGYDGRTLIHDFSTRLIRGDKIGLIGPNGVGKSTLLKLILGEIEPDSGTVKRGTNLQVAYFDQMRSQLDEDATLIDTISPGSDYVMVGGNKKHTITYLSDFLFPSERAFAPVRTLSGGERNRLLLARLFAQAANVLVLDEPTNDLDLETLELLEELLQDYTGTLFLVSHDRSFLDNVVTQTIAFEGDGVLREYPGGYTDWHEAQARMAEISAATKPAAKPEPKAEAKSTAAAESAPARAARKRLSNYEERELAALPDRIDALERNIAAQQARLADPMLYRDAPQEVKGLQDRIAALEADLGKALERWEELEARRSA